jgi:hypothetical protein
MGEPSRTEELLFAGSEDKYCTANAALQVNVNKGHDEPRSRGRSYVLGCYECVRLASRSSTGFVGGSALQIRTAILPALRHEYWFRGADQNQGYRSSAPVHAYWRGRANMLATARRKPVLTPERIGTLEGAISRFDRESYLFFHPFWRTL